MEAKLKYFYYDISQSNVSVPPGSAVPFPSNGLSTTNSSIKRKSNTSFILVKPGIYQVNYRISTTANASGGFSLAIKAGDQIQKPSSVAFGSQFVSDSFPISTHHCNTEISLINNDDGYGSFTTAGTGSLQITLLGSHCK